MNPLLAIVVPVLIVEGAKLLADHLRHEREKDRRQEEVERRLGELERKTECLK